MLKAMGIPDLLAFDFMDPPPAQTLFMPGAPPAGLSGVAFCLNPPPKQSTPPIKYPLPKKSTPWVADSGDQMMHAPFLREKVR